MDLAIEGCEAGGKVSESSNLDNEIIEVTRTRSLQGNLDPLFLSRHAGLRVGPAARRLDDKSLRCALCFRFKTGGL